MNDTQPDEAPRFSWRREIVMFVLIISLSIGLPGIVILPTVLWAKSPEINWHHQPPKYLLPAALQ